MLNNLPLHVEQYPSAYIVNTTFSTTPGEHWLALYFSSPQHCYVSDSYGRDLSTLPSQIHSFAARNSLLCTYNTLQIQDVASQTCGLYCILFLLAMSRTCNLTVFQRLFCNDLQQKDIFVYHILYIYYNL